MSKDENVSGYGRTEALVAIATAQGQAGQFSAAFETVALIERAAALTDNRRRADYHAAASRTEALLAIAAAQRQAAKMTMPSSSSERFSQTPQRQTHPSGQQSWVESPQLRQKPGSLTLPSRPPCRLKMPQNARLCFSVSLQYRTKQATAKSPKRLPTAPRSGAGNSRPIRASAGTQ